MIPKQLWLNWPDLCGHQTPGGQGKRKGVTESTEETGQLGLTRQRVVCLPWAPMGTSTPDRQNQTQCRGSAGSVLFSFFFKKKKLKLKQQNVDACQIYMASTQRTYYVLYFCVCLNYFMLFLKKSETVGCDFKSTAGRSCGKRGLQECGNQGWCGPGQQGQAWGMQSFP